jgi:hypothetical protein
MKHFQLLVATLLCPVLLMACSPKAAAPAAVAQPGNNLQLTAGEQTKLGLEKAPAQAASYAPQIEGYALVLNHEAIALAAAELVTAQVTASASRASLTRTEHLKGTPGALVAESEEAARRQAAADAATLALARQRLTAQFGQHAPWLEPASGALLSKLAEGRVKIVRVTFPSGTPPPRPAPGLRFTRLEPAPGSGNWHTRQVWPAPADSSVPGRSYFATLSGSEIAEGERLAASADSGDMQSGVVIPTEALVISAGKTWCYLEKPAGTFTRVAIDTGRAGSGGYFIQGSIAPGETIVTGGAGLLLARETSPGGEAE